MICRAPASLGVVKGSGNMLARQGCAGKVRGGCCFMCVSENSNFVVFLDVCRVRPCVIGRAPASLGVVGMLGEQFGSAGGRGGGVGVCVLGVS